MPSTNPTQGWTSYAVWTDSGSIKLNDYWNRYLPYANDFAALHILASGDSYHAFCQFSLNIDEMSMI